MRLVRDIERRLERLMESPGRALGGILGPEELEARLTRAGDLSLTVVPAGPAAPNRYDVRLNPRDLRSLPDGAAPTLAAHLESNAAERGWRLEGPVEIHLLGDEQTSKGEIGWSADTLPGPLTAWARLTSPHQILLVRHNRALLGRDPSCDVVVSNRQVSRVHALIWREGGSAWIEDRRSTNGTFVDGLGVPRPVIIEPEATITLGPVSFAFEPL